MVPKYTDNNFYGWAIGAMGRNGRMEAVLLECCNVNKSGAPLAPGKENFSNMTLVKAMNEDDKSAPEPWSDWFGKTGCSFLLVEVPSGFPIVDCGREIFV